MYKLLPFIVNNFISCIQLSQIGT